MVDELGVLLIVEKWVFLVFLVLGVYYAVLGLRGRLLSSRELSVVYDKRKDNFIFRSNCQDRAKGGPNKIGLNST